MNRKIGLFDSGVGGLTTLNEIKRILPNEDYVYYADSINNPYGSKSDKELLEITKKIVDKLITKKVKLIVIACNTATTKCIDDLRALYPKMIFVGTEPAIKVACDNNYKNTLVLATPGTISSKRTKELIEKNKKSNEKIHLIACEGLANAIERNDKLEIRSLLDKYLLPFTDKKIDAIVLGCTHYPIIKDDIRVYFKDAVIIDGNNGVARRVKHELIVNNLLNDKGTTQIEFIISK